MSATGPSTPRDAPQDVSGPDQDAAESRNLERRYRAFRHGMRGNRALDLSWRIGVLSLGVVVVGAGIAMLVLPGPGWATIFIGLLILASEFAWARRSLDWARDRAKRARDQALAPEVRRRNQVIAMVVALGVVVAVLLYWQVYGFPGPVGRWLSENLWR